MGVRENGLVQTGSDAGGSVGGWDEVVDGVGG